MKIQYKGYQIKYKVYSWKLICGYGKLRKNKIAIYSLLILLPPKCNKTRVLFEYKMFSEEWKNEYK